MTDEKPKKVEDGAKARSRRPFNFKKTEYRAPTSGLENAIFEYGLPKHTAQFTQMLEDLAKHVAVSF